MSPCIPFIKEKTHYLVHFYCTPKVFYALLNFSNLGLHALLGGKKVSVEPCTGVCLISLELWNTLFEYSFDISLDLGCEFPVGKMCSTCAVAFSRCHGRVPYLPTAGHSEFLTAVCAHISPGLGLCVLMYSRVLHWTAHKQFEMCEIKF